jgi:putative transposase
VLVDTEGNLLAVVVLSAAYGDRYGLEVIWAKRPAIAALIRKLWADRGYSGEAFGAWFADQGVDLEIVGGDRKGQGFAVEPRRWVVERTLGWLGRSRRLAKDYEHHTENAESMIYLASIARLLNRVCSPVGRPLPYASKLAA